LQRYKFFSSQVEYARREVVLLEKRSLLHQIRCLEREAELDSIILSSVIWNLEIPTCPQKKYDDTNQQ